MAGMQLPDYLKGKDVKDIAKVIEEASDDTATTED